MAKHDKRINPRRRPATEADVKKAELRGIDQGVKDAVRVTLYLLIDKHNAPIEDVAQLQNEIQQTASHIIAGRLSWSYIETVLKDNGIKEIRWR